MVLVCGAAPPSGRSSGMGGLGGWAVGSGFAFLFLFRGGVRGEACW